MRVFLGALCVVLASLLAWIGLRPAPQSGGQFSGVDIVFLIGGAPGQSFSDSVHHGVRAAERDLGCNVTVRWTHWERDRLLTQLKTAIALEPDGICLMGFPGQEAMGPLVDEAVRQGIVVTSWNTAIPDMEDQYRRFGFGFAGQDGYSAGHALAAKALAKSGISAPARVLVVGSASVPGRGQRAEGCLAALREAGLTPDYIDLPQALAATPPRNHEDVFLEYLAEHPDVALVLQDAASVAESARLLAEAGHAPGAVFLAGFDVTAENLAAIESGYCGLLLDQQEFLEGYLAVLQVCFSRRLGVTGLNIETTGGFVDETNLDDFKRLFVERRQ
jgi:simple sugar transport system substrate-binding protein